MPQAWLPLIPRSATQINETWSVEKRNRRWFYFCGLNPVFSHAEEDRQTFRMYTAQLVYQGQCKQSEIIRVFGVSRNSVSRSVTKFKEGGADDFYAYRKGRGCSVFTDVVKAQAQELLVSGETKKEVAEKLGIKYDTLRKAVSQGRLIEPAATKSTSSPATDKSTRSFDDAGECQDSCRMKRSSCGLIGGAFLRVEDDGFNGVPVSCFS